MSGSILRGSALAQRPSTKADPGSIATQYGAALLLVAAATVAAFAFRSLVPAPSLTLFYVLPVLVAAVSFGWGPSLAATVVGVLAYDFFFTQPYYSFTIASPTDISDAALLLVIAASVSAVAAESRRRAQAASLGAEQAEALQALAHMIVERRPAPEVARAAARALNRLLDVPSVVLTERDGALELSGQADVDAIGDADWEAAVASLTTQAPMHGGVYPAEAARFDFWPFGSGAGAVVVGLDYSQADHPRDLARLVELVGGYLAAAARATTASAPAS
jgi:two-component system sensor histidine kinase KdpD